MPRFCFARWLLLKALKAFLASGAEPAALTRRRAADRAGRGPSLSQAVAGAFWVRADLENDGLAAAW